MCWTASDATRTYLLFYFFDVMLWCFLLELLVIMVFSCRFDKSVETWACCGEYYMGCVFLLNDLVLNLGQLG
jgi:hypothetical protein